MAGIRRALDAATNALLAVSGAALLIMSLHIVADVAGRYLFRAPLPGTVEIVARYYMVFLVFLPLAYVQKRGTHFVAGIFTDRMAHRPRQLLIGLAHVGMAVVAVLLVWAGIEAAIHAMRTAEQVQAAEFLLMVWPARWLAPLGFALMAIYAVLSAAECFSAARSGERKGAAPDNRQ